MLLHGIAGTNAVWDEMFAPLAEKYDVIAPDYPGHGQSGSSSGDYSVGGLAATVRDLLLAIGIDGATIVGHSLGGGVAMQFCYLFPEYAERLVLISSGGLGRSVNPVLRAAALPGAEIVTAGLGVATRTVASIAGAIPFVPRPGRVATELERSVSALADSEIRTAFHATLRAVVGPVGQRVFAGDRLYLTAAIPTLIAWGEHDKIIPVGHGRRAHASMPGSRFVVFEHAGHFPPLEAAPELCDAMTEFIETTKPAAQDVGHFRALLRQGAQG